MIFYDAGSSTQSFFNPVPVIRQKPKPRHKADLMQIREIGCLNDSGGSSHRDGSRVFDASQ